MDKIIFLNCTQHELTQQQKQAAVELIKNDNATLNIVIEFIDIKQTEIFEKIKESADNKLELLKQAKILKDYIYEKLLNEAIKVYVHLPIGSPAFMFLFTLMAYEVYGIRVVYLFSYTKRKAIEKDGIKTSVFEFEKFIII